MAPAHNHARQKGRKCQCGVSRYSLCTFLARKHELENEAFGEFADCASCMLDQMPSAVCNPISRGEFDTLVAHLEGQLPAVQGDKGDFRWIGKCPTVTAIGGPTSMCRLPGLLLLNGTCREDEANSIGYSLSDVYDAANVILGKTDFEIASIPARFSVEELSETNQAPCVSGQTLGDLCLEPHLAATKLALLVAVMRRCQMQRVRHQFAIGSCPGLLVHPAYFP